MDKKAWRRRPVVERRLTHGTEALPFAMGDVNLSFFSSGDKLQANRTQE
jgi:hypothetical protein